MGYQAKNAATAPTEILVNGDRGKVQNIKQVPWRSSTTHPELKFTWM